MTGPASDAQRGRDHQNLGMRGGRMLHNGLLDEVRNAARQRARVVRFADRRCGRETGIEGAKHGRGRWVRTELCCMGRYEEDRILGLRGFGLTVNFLRPRTWAYQEPERTL